MRKEIFLSPFASCALSNAPEGHIPSHIPTSYHIFGNWVKFLSPEVFNFASFGFVNLECTRVYWDDSVDRTSFRISHLLLKDPSPSIKDNFFLVKISEGTVCAKLRLPDLSSNCYQLFQTHNLIYLFYKTCYPNSEQKLRAFDIETLEEVTLDRKLCSRMLQIFTSNPAFFRDFSRCPETLVYIKEGNICRLDSDFNPLHQKDLKEIYPGRSEEEIPLEIKGSVMKIDDAGKIYLSFDYWVVILDPDFERKGEFYLPDFFSGGTFHGRNFFQNGNYINSGGHLEKRMISHYNLPGGDLHLNFYLEAQPGCGAYGIQGSTGPEKEPPEKEPPADDQKVPFDYNNNFLLKTTFISSS